MTRRRNDSEGEKEVDRRSVRARGVEEMWSPSIPGYPCYSEDKGGGERGGGIALSPSRGPSGRGVSGDLERQRGGGHVGPRPKVQGTGWTPQGRDREDRRKRRAAQPSTFWCSCPGLLC